MDQRRRETEAARDEADGRTTAELRLHGHLFDSNLINQASSQSRACVPLDRVPSPTKAACIFSNYFLHCMFFFCCLHHARARHLARSRSHTQCHTHITGAVSFGVRRGRGPAARALAQVLALLDASGVSFSLGECLGNPGAKTTALIALGPLADPAVLDTVIEKVAPAPAPAPALVRTPRARTQKHARNMRARTHARMQASKTHARTHARTHSPLSASISVSAMWMGASLSFRPDGWVCVQGRYRHTGRDRIDRVPWTARDEQRQVVKEGG